MKNEGMKVEVLEGNGRPKWDFPILPQKYDFLVGVAAKHNKKSPA